MKWRIYPSQRGRVNKLVHRRCCCYDHGNCILLDDGEPHRCVQIISRSGIYCNYFRRAVLPSDSELYAQIRDQNKWGGYADWEHLKQDCHGTDHGDQFRSDHIRMGMP